MSAEIINLRQARKRRAREARAAEAAGNRARFGRTRAERELAETSEARARKILDGHRRESEPEPHRETPPADGAIEKPAPKSP
jgi:hypothetical protein